MVSQKSKYYLGTFASLIVFVLLCLLVHWPGRGVRTSSEKKVPRVVETATLFVKQNNSEQVNLWSLPDATDLGKDGLETRKVQHVISDRHHLPATRSKMLRYLQHFASGFHEDEWHPTA